MCGIGGRLHIDPARSVEREMLGRMNAAQAHRGPDDSGTYCQGPVALARRRPSIIDLSPADHQSMANEDGTVWIIVFNGEIYDFQVLRSRLETCLGTGVHAGPMTIVGARVDAPRFSTRRYPSRATGAAGKRGRSCVGRTRSARSGPR